MGMRRIAAVLVIALVAVSSASAATAKRPILGLRGDTVQGVNFKPREKVTVLAGSAMRVVKTDAAGTFSLVMKGVSSKSRCGGGIVVQAFGARGERATFSIGGLDCADVGST
jgi:ABC-type molybdate transport system substrate-binding protein